MWGFRSKLFVVIERILELLLSIALKVTGTSKVGDSAQVRQLNLPDKILLTVAALLAIGQKIPILMEVPYAYSILTYGLIVAIVFLILSPVLAKLEDSIAPCPREFPGFKTIQLLSKEEVGYRPDMLRDLETNIKKGKVLLRGPRGSGKKDAFLAALLGLKEFNQGKLHFSYDCANLKEEELKAFVERAKRYKEGLVLYIESAHLGYESPAFQQIIETFPCVVLSSSGQVAKEPIFPGFKVMELQELGQDKTVKILRNLLKRKYPIETLSDELLITIYNESMRVNTGLANPEKSIHILEKFLESDRGSGTDRMAAKRVEWEDARISLIEALSFEEKHPEDEFAWVDGRVDDQWYADVDASIRSKQSAHVKIRVIDKALDRLQKEQEVILKPMEKLQKVHRDRLLCSERADAILRRFNPDDPNEQLIRRWIYLDILITKYDKIVVQCKEELQKLNILPVVTEEQIAVFVRTKYQLREGS